jgi:uncharacterized membrane protein
LDDSETDALEQTLRRNIDLMRERESDKDRRRSTEQKISDTISAFAARMSFVYVHLAIVVVWVLCNSGIIPWLPRWDPSFVLLATAASVEAIFISSFILVSQNRMAEMEKRRAELDLQINLLTEHELTKAITLLARLAEKHAVDGSDTGEIKALQKDVDPADVLEKLEETDPA